MTIQTPFILLPASPGRTPWMIPNPEGLIERAQFALNPKMYERGAFKELSDQGFNGTWLEWFLKETETFHGTWHD